RGGGRSGARPDVRRGPQSARVSGARRERGAQRRLRPAHWPPRPHGPPGAPGAAGRRRGRARVRGDGPAHVRRSGDDRIRPDPRAPRDRGTGAHGRDAGALAGWRRASRPRRRLCGAALDGAPGHRALLAPGDLTRRDALVLAGRQAVRLVGASVLLLGLAGTIEGLLSASDAPAPFKFATSGATVVLLILYVASGRHYLNSQATGQPGEQAASAA